MKKYLILLLLALISVASPAQTFKTQKVKRVKVDGTVERGRARRNMDVYQTPTSDATFINAINARTVSMTTAAGTVIPALHGNPAWIQALRHTYTADRKLTVDAVPGAGASLELSIRLVSNGTLSIQSNGGTALIPGTFYGPGTQNNQGAFVREWTLFNTAQAGSGVPPEPVALTMRNNGSDLFTYTFTPRVGVHQAVTGGAVGGNTSPPGSTTNPAAPNWLSARYTWSGNRLDVEGAPVNTSGVTLNIKRQDGQALSIQSSGGQELNSTDFYPSGPLDNQGSYVQEWSFTPRAGGGVPAGVPIVLTFRKPDGTTYAHTFPPANATRQVLFTASTGGTGPVNPPPTAGTLASYRRGIFIGNSFTSHRASTVDLGWSNNNGMAASSLANDYVHKMETALKGVNPAFEALALGNGSSFEGDYRSNDPDAISNLISNTRSEIIARFGSEKSDLLAISIGENTDNNGFNDALFRAKLSQYLAGLSDLLTPNYTLLTRTSCWQDHSGFDGAIRTWTTEKGGKLADMTSIMEQRNPDFSLSWQYYATQYSNGGVRRHPNDDGHAAIANRLLDQLRTSGGSNPPPSPPGGTGAGQGVYAANSSYVALPEAGGRAAMNQPNYISNGTIRVGITPTAGDVITHWHEGQAESMVNNPIFGDGSLDLGRQIMDGIYGFPDGSVRFRDEGQGAGVEELGEGPYVEPAPYNQSTDRFHGGNGAGSIGYNPVQGGDEAFKGTGNAGKQKASPVLTHHVQANKSYSKTQPLQWDLDNVPGKVYTEKWLDFDPSYNRGFRMHTRWTMFRDDPQSNEDGTYRDQEVPCAYITPDFNQYYVCWGQPYTNAPLHHHVINESTQQQPVQSTEGVIFAYSAMRNKWMALFAPYTQFSAGIFNFGYGQQPSETGPSSFQSGYINLKVAMHLDKNGVYDFDAAFATGNSLDEVRAWVYAQPRMSGKPEYVFNQRSRLFWHHHHAKDNKEANMTDGMVVTPINLRRAQFGKDMKAKSPYVWVNGREVKHIYIKAGFTSHNGNMQFRWKKAGDNNEYTQPFTVNSNGTVQVYDINLEGNPNWNNQDVIHYWIEHEHPAQPGERWDIKWVSWRNLNN